VSALNLETGAGGIADAGNCGKRAAGEAGQMAEDFQTGLGRYEAEFEAAVVEACAGGESDGTGAGPFGITRASVQEATGVGLTVEADRGQGGMISQHGVEDADSVGEAAAESTLEGGGGAADHLGGEADSGEGEGETLSGESVGVRLDFDDVEGLGLTRGEGAQCVGEGTETELVGDVVSGSAREYAHGRVGLAGLEDAGDHLLQGAIAADGDDRLVFLGGQAGEFDTVLGVACEKHFRWRNPGPRITGESGDPAGFAGCARSGIDDEDHGGRGDLTRYGLASSTAKAGRGTGCLAVRGDGCEAGLWKAGHDNHIISVERSRGE